MEEKKVIYEIILFIWNIAKELLFSDLSNEDCESIDYRVDKEEKRLRELDESYSFLFRGIWHVFMGYYERKKGK